MLNSIINQLTDNHRLGSVSSKLRKQRFAVFQEKLSVGKKTKILDVGGTSQTWAGTGLEPNVTLLNLHHPKQRDIEQGFTCIKGNALDMHMFSENEFDVVFSNSVIEHVGCKKNQRLFVAEICRVGRSYWVQTPNKYFPVEPHLLFPFFQFLPEAAQKKIAISWPYSHYKKWDLSNERILQDLNSLRLLSRQELLALFSNCSLYKEKYFGLIKSFAAYRTTIL